MEWVQTSGRQPAHHLMSPSCFLWRVPFPSWRLDVGDKDFHVHRPWVLPSPFSQTLGSQRRHFSRLEGLLKGPTLPPVLPSVHV